MSDVGVLSLQIHDNSAKAAEGLGRLATALGRVRGAVGNGLKLGGVANQITRLNEALKEAIPEHSLASLERFAAAIEKINAAGSIKLSGIKASADSFNAEGAAEKIRKQIEDGTAEGFERVNSRLEETSERIDRMNSRMGNFNQLVQQTAWAAGDMADRFSEAFQIWDKMRAASSLGGGNTARLGDGAGSNSTGWQYYNPWGETSEKGWTSWKDGAIEAEYTISDTAEQVFDQIDNRIEGTRVLLLEAGQEARETFGALEEVAGYKRVWDSASREFKNVGYTQSELYSRIAEMSALRESTSGADTSGIDEAFRNTGGAIDEARSRLEDFGAALQSVLRNGVSSFGAGIRRLLSPLTSLASQFARVAKYRFLRAVLKEITGAVSEGTENYYRYSQAIGSAFAPAMDSAASSLQTMRNSIGAALAPLIQSLIPYLQMAVSWFVNLINLANQFIALLRGQPTWSRATNQSAKAFDNVKKSAGGAAAAIKDLLADWDELNIIQSESGGGGGGGGGAKAMEDYLGMFEEVGEFDSRLKSMLDIIENGFGNILNLAGLIGTAILGWKISNAFGGVIGALGALLASGAMITIGVELGYGAGFSAGAKGYFDATDILATVASTVAGGIGGWIISQSATGVVIGMGISLVATLYGYIEGKQDSEDKLRWGDTSMTPEEVRKYVEDQFSFDVQARINVLDAIIENRRAAKAKLDTTITNFSDSLSKVRISVDGTPQGINDAANAARGVIEQINSNLKESEEALEVLTKITPITSPDGETDITSDFLSGITIADQKLSDYFTGLGEQIAGWIDAGEKSKWKNNEAEMAMALMQHQQAIVNQAEQNRSRRSFQVDTELNLSSMTRDTAQAVFEEQIALVDEYTSKIREAYEGQAKDLYYMADLADAAGLRDDEGNPLSDTYIAAAKELMAKIESGEIYDEIAPDVAKMREQWIEQLQKVYGGDIDITGMTQMSDLISDMFGKGTYFEEDVRKALDKGGIETAAKVIEQKLNNLMEWIDPEHIARNAAEKFGFSLFDILELGDQKQLIDSIYNAVGGDTDTAYAILNAMGISNESIAAALKSEIASAASDMDGASEAWKQVLDSMWAADWQHMADEELLAFVNAMRERFGSDAVSQALQELDIPEADLTVPMKTTVEETVQEDVKVDTSGATGEVELDASEITVLGVPVGDGWFGNLLQGVFGQQPLSTDATVHVNLDPDDEDLHIWDLLEDETDANIHVYVDTDDEDLHIWDLLEDESDRTGRRLWNPNMVKGTGGTQASANYAGGLTGGEEMQITVQMDDSRQQGNIQNGVQNATSSLLSTLQSILSTANAINRKNFTVNIMPTSSLGRVNGRSVDMYNMVTGENA